MKIKQLIKKFYFKALILSVVSSCFKTISIKNDWFKFFNLKDFFTWQRWNIQRVKTNFVLIQIQTKWFFVFLIDFCESIKWKASWTCFSFNFYWL